MWVFWFILKMIGAGLGLLFRAFKKGRGSDEERIHEGRACSISYTKHKGTITSRGIGVDFEGPKFRLVKESKWDVRFKNWGLSTELQTGDQEFDDLVYVISDNPTLATHLKVDKSTREAILSILTDWYNEIHCDGKKLWIVAQGNSEVSKDDLENIVELARHMGGMKAERVPVYREPFFVKATITECVLWSFAGYALVGFFEMLSARETLTLHFSHLLTAGVSLGLLLFVILIQVVRTVFKGSSRGHRLILESTFLLICSLPIGGTMLVEDLNIGLDSGPGIVVNVPVSSLYKKKHSTKNGHYYTFHAMLDPTGKEKVDMPNEIAVSRAIFASASGKKELGLTLGEGALGLPWIKGVRWNQ